MPTTRLRTGAGRRKDYAAMAGKKPRKARQPRLAKPAAKAVRKIVKAEIHRMAEDKMVSVSQSQVHNQPIGVGDVYPLVPRIPQGADSFQRIGDSIRPKRLVARFRVGLSSGYWANLQGFTVPIQCRLMILKQKSIKNNGQLGTFDAAHLLRPQIGGSAEVPFSGTSTDMMSPINTDLFEVVLDRKFWLSPQNVAATNNNTYPLLANTVEITKVLKVPAKLTFDQGNGDSPNNFAPFAVIGWAQADGNTGVLNTPVEMEVLSSLYFEDQ